MQAREAELRDSRSALAARTQECHSLTAAHTVLTAQLAAATEKLNSRAAGAAAAASAAAAAAAAAAERTGLQNTIDRLQQRIAEQDAAYVLVKDELSRRGVQADRALAKVYAHTGAAAECLL